MKKILFSGLFLLGISSLACAMDKLPGSPKFITSTEVHVEFVLIHPFREGNGRIARVVTTLMALQAARPILDFNSIQQGSGKQQYFGAIRAGFDRNYDPMQKIIETILKKTLDRQASGK